ncbi:MAG: sugar ABC transporter ATP-binding protein [Treponema sp.]|jgi:ribose transport system ATP-binding protein|nr:sugar ABC transporter ATP-binding protein [Treponema sp.]
MKNETSAILKLSNISKSFRGVKALVDVSFELQRGEVHAICGENGAGKSTLIKILSGALQHDGGTITFEGTPIPQMTPERSFKLGVHTIYQENTLVPWLTVAENLYIGQEICFPKTGLIDWKSAFNKTADIMKSLKMNIAPRSFCANLGIAEQQAVQIAKTLAHECKVVVMDEPTASFGKAEIDNLFRIIRMLREEGKGIIYISHHLDEVFEIADRITVLRDGRYVNTFPVKEVTKAVLIDNMVGRSLGDFYDKEIIELGEEIFRVEKLSRGNAVKDVNFSVHRGEILGIYGMVGAGRTELARLIFGVDKAGQGKVFLRGAEITPKNPEDAIKAGLAFITEDRRRGGLVTNQSIENNMVLPSLRKFKNLFVSPKTVRSIGRRMMGELQIKAPDPGTVVENLSGGNQQKVVVAKWLYAGAEVYIFDEPTRGIDVGAKQELYNICTNLAKQGKAIVFITSEMEELLSMSDRVLVMRGGRISAEIPKEGITQTRVLYEAIGGEKIG